MPSIAKWDVNNVILLHYPSWSQQLANDFTAAILAIAPDTDLAITTSNPLTVHRLPLPLFSVNPDCPQRWATPLPLKLASRTGRSPQALAQELIAFLTEYWQANQTPLLSPEVNLLPNGWLCLQWSEAAIATELQAALGRSLTGLDSGLTQGATGLSVASGVSPDPVVFQLQYAHARCCSLLRLAQAAKLITLSSTAIPQAQWLSPDPIPWGNLWRNSASSALLNLLHGLLTFPQPLAFQKQLWGQGFLPQTTTSLLQPHGSAIWRQQAQDWSTLFLRFYRQHQCLVPPKGDRRDLCQTWLGLVWLTRPILAWILQTGLQASAPPEL